VGEPARLLSSSSVEREPDVFRPNPVLIKNPGKNQYLFWFIRKQANVAAPDPHDRK
jgi:hypothetical protein